MNRIDLTPASLDITVYAGDGEDFQIKFVDDANLPIDVSGFTWLAQIRRFRSSTSFLSIEIDDSNADTGILKLHISSEVTRILADVNVWDLQSTSVARPDPLTILQGKVYCIEDVTREDSTPVHLLVISASVLSGVSDKVVVTPGALP